MTYRYMMILALVATSCNGEPRHESVTSTAAPSTNQMVSQEQTAEADVQQLPAPTRPKEDQGVDEMLRALKTGDPAQLPGAMGLREVLEDLEVVQEKRTIRIRKPKTSPRFLPTIELMTSSGTGGDASTFGEKHPGQHRWVNTVDVALSTFAADVDAGSYTMARRAILEGRSPRAATIRAEEWVNYFDYGYESDDGPSPFTIVLDAAPSPFQTSLDYRLLRVGVQADRVTQEERMPVHLTFLIDVSGSMDSDDKMGLVIESLTTLVAALKHGDTVAIVTYASGSDVLLKPTDARNTSKILKVIQGLTASGGTAMAGGLEVAYELAAKTFVVGHENRVMVLSDGDANVGRVSLPEMLKVVSRHARRGITLSTVGYGTDRYNEHLMEQLANNGNGNYHYIDGPKEAHRVFGEHLGGTMVTVARDVKLQVEFDPAVVKRYRQIGYENRALANDDFRNDDVDAGTVGSGHAVTALYEVELVAAEHTEDANLAVARVRYKAPGSADVAASELQSSLPLSHVVTSISDTGDSFRWAASVAAFAELARKAPDAEQLSLSWIEEVARGAAGHNPQRLEFLDLLKRAKSLGL